ncbi:MAG TPA: hypothetical protein VEK13_04240 [Thermoplasmata archaeon]|nr:hypothetical protein [Thermoplasmata archaeon]
MIDRTTPRDRFRGLGSWGLLGAIGGLFGFVTGLPHGEGAITVIAGVLLGGWMQRQRSRGRLRSLAPIPVLVALGATAVASPLGLLPELLAGASGLAVLVWLADDPGRPVGGVARARLTVGIPALALGIAWSSALLLPSSSAPIGVAAGLLVFVLVAVAFLIGWPSTFDREEPSAS